MEEKFIPLAEAPRILRDDYKVEVSYRKLYALVLDGKVPARKDPRSGRWLIPEGQLLFVRSAINTLPIDVK